MSVVLETKLSDVPKICSRRTWIVRWLYGLDIAVMLHEADIGSVVVRL